MANPPFSPENMLKNHSELSDDDQSHLVGMIWANTGDHLVKIGTNMRQFGNQMMMRGGSLFPRATSETTAASRPAVDIGDIGATHAEGKLANDEMKRRLVKEETSANKRTRSTPPLPLCFPFETPPVASSTPMIDTFIATVASKAPPVTPSLSTDTLPSEPFSPPFLPDLLDGVDMNPSNIFPDAGDTSNTGYDLDMIDEDIKRFYELPDQEKKQGNNSREGTYLKKFVANTSPKMTLKTYFQHNDGNRICLCGRGGHNNHPGNKDYRDFVSKLLQDYISRSDGRKEQLTNAVVQEFEDQGRRFFSLNANDEWEEIDQDSARTKIRAKISQRFRDTHSKGL